MRLRLTFRRWICRIRRRRVTAASAEQLARGEALVRRGDAARKLPACIACHGAALTGVAPNVPGLLGLPRDYLIGQLGGWQTGLRKAFEPDCMAPCGPTAGAQ